jgi:DNA-binding winged helix-turn-helix (wHTH) protein
MNTFLFLLTINNIGKGEDMFCCSLVTIRRKLRKLPVWNATVGFKISTKKKKGFKISKKVISITCVKTASTG